MTKYDPWKKRLDNVSQASLPAMRKLDTLPVPPFRDRYTHRDVRSPPRNAIGLACGCTIPEILIVLIGTRGQQVYCFDHRQYSKIYEQQIRNAKRLLKRELDTTGLLFDAPF